MDEYDNYIEPVRAILEGSRSEEDLVEYLIRTEENIMGTNYSTQEQQDRMIPVARKLLGIVIGS